MDKLPTFGDLPSFGIWKDKPQTELEGFEGLEKIKNMADAPYFNESEATYGCLDLRENIGD